MIVLNSLRHFHNQRHDLFAACLMSDHVHSIKSFSAHKINEVENKAGAVWEEKRFHRYIRSGRDLEEKFHYILRNPWDSGVAKQNEDYLLIWVQHDEGCNESSFRRDAETSTRDACATQRRET
jgi:type I restriction-modification system DNA methylase subunit